ncbi:MAG: LacI family DNA-binding transcriptional regulator [Steroidobacteraceae bacterium]|jgi:LacI family transcriptional regulator
MTKPLSGIRLIAQRAGVHVSTVSRALNPQTRTRLSHEVATRILKIASDLSYTRNPLAFGLKTRRSFTVGVIVPDITNPLFPPIVRAVERTLGKEGYVTMLADSDNNREKERAILDSLQARQVDGLILATAWLQDDIVKKCQEQNIPFVLVNRTVLDEAVTCVVTNDVYGIRLAVDHLLQLGHRKLAYVGGPLNTSTGTGRRAGFFAALKAYRMTVRERLVVDCPSFTVQAGAVAARKLLGTANRSFTAIVAANDMLALGCYDALAEAGLECPADISITGYNDMPFADRFNPPLTTLRIPHDQIGVQSSLLLLRMMRDPTVIVPSVHLEPLLAVRGSTASPQK